MRWRLSPGRTVAAALAALAVLAVASFGTPQRSAAQQTIRTTPIGGHIGTRPHSRPHSRPRSGPTPHARVTTRPGPAPTPLVLPVVPPGSPIAGEAHAANVFRPTLFRALFRVPRSDARLYVTAGLFARDLLVTVVGPKTQQRTYEGATILSGRELGVALPSDAWRADGIAVTMTTVTAHDPPYVDTAETIALRAWNDRWHAAAFALSAAFALVFGWLAYVRRSRLLAYAAAFALAEALLSAPFLGIVRLPPQLSQPLDALFRAGAMAALTLFTLAYAGAALPARFATVLWTMVGINIAVRVAADLLQDYALVVDFDTTIVLNAVLTALMLLAFVAAGVLALRARVDGAAFYLAGTAAAFAGYVDFVYGVGTPLAFGQPDPLLGTMGEVLLFAGGLLTTMRAAPAAPLVRIDGLTGIASRAAFDETMERARRAAARRGAPLALLLVDIDHFRRYNDRYGPAAGDGALRAIAAALELTTRDEDACVARYRGATLAALLPHDDLHAANAIAKRAMAAIATEAIEHEGVPAKRLTVSVGVASVAANDESGTAGLRKRAENALYIAKAMGRNRIVLDEPIAPPPPDELAEETSASI